MSGNHSLDMQTAESVLPLTAPAPSLYRKLAWRIVPLAVIGYTIAQIDRSNVAFAKLQFLTQLHLNEAVYGLGAGLFFAGYFLFEMPSNLLLSRIGARLTFTRIMVLWGLISVAMAFISSANQFYIARFFLGAAEAGFFPGIILYFSYWLPSEIRGRATSFFAMGASISGIIGSPLSGWLMSLDGLAGLRGWQLLFICEGVPAILMGLFCYFYVTDKPEQASFLTPAEKHHLATRLAAEKALEAKREGSLADAFRDPKVYLLALAYLSILAGTQAVTLWTPTLLKKLGYNITEIGFLATLPPITAIIGIFLVARSSDRLQERRWHFACPMFAAGLALAGLTFAAGNVVLTLGLLGVTAAGAWAALAVFWTIPPAYLSAPAKAGAIGFISSFGAIGGFVSPIIVGWSAQLTGSLSGGLAVIGAMLALSALALLAFMRRQA